MIRVAIDGRYPAPGDIKIVLTGEYMPVSLRIPLWSGSARVRIGGAVFDAAPGEAFPVAGWKDRAEIVLTLDFSPRFEEGGMGYAGMTSVYSGPVLYGADATRNPQRGLDGLPPLSRAALRASRPAPAPDGSILWQAGDVTLCDFYHLGLSGAEYRTWLRTDD